MTSMIGAAAGKAVGAATKVTGVTNAAAEFLFEQRPMSHRFIVRIDRGLYDLGSWSKVSGLTVRWSKHAYRTGESSSEQWFPGNIANEPLKLSRAACSDSATVQTWLAQTTRHRKTYTGAVSLLDFLGLPVVTWELRELFPISWSIGDMDSGSARPVIETLELLHSGFLADEGLVN